MTVEEADGYNGIRVDIEAEFDGLNSGDGGPAGAAVPKSVLFFHRLFKHLGMVFVSRVITLYMIVLTLSLGCARNRVPTSMGDMSYVREREQISIVEIPFPSQTPYDNNSEARDFYLRGFETGWRTTLKMWYNARFSPPFANDSTDERAKAWRDGALAGSAGVAERVSELRARALEEKNDSN